MPELPEVESVVRRLRDGLGAPSVIGRRILAADVRWHREVSGVPAERFVAEVAGATVHGMGRHGKYLIFTLGRGKHSFPMLVHLKMSGRLDVVPNGEADTKHARVIWRLDGGLALRFEDARKFGRVYLPSALSQVVGKLGPDALTVSALEFGARLAAKKGALKPILLDQTFIAGVGNIYADESLHRSGLHPKRLAASLSETERVALHKNVIAVLEEGIRANGASFDWVYPDGNFQDNFQVYGRTGEPCRRCGGIIQRILVGQRSTHFCPTCQR
jgi:formamidopyrimidine-DNA glycosylase